jgi:predicted  nucleic acid-binding Zn-ribbon protein
MTIENENVRQQHSVVNAQTDYGFNFKILNQADIRVVLTTSAGVETVKTLATHYTVFGVGSQSGGTVKFTSGNIPATSSSATVTLILDTEMKQTMDLSYGVAIDSEALESALDNLLNINKRTRDITTNQPLISSVATLESEMTAVEGRATTLEGEMTAVEGRSTTLEGEMTAVEGQATTLIGEMTAVEGRATTLEGEMTVVEARSTTLEGEMNVVEGQATTLIGEMTAVEGRATTLEGEMNVVEGRATTLEGEMNVVEADIVTLEAETISTIQNVSASTTTLVIPNAQINAGHVRIGVTGTLDIQNVAIGPVGQFLTLFWRTGGSATAIHSGGGAGQLVLSDGLDVTPSGGDAITLISNAVNWYETARTEPRTALNASAISTLEGEMNAVEGRATTLESSVGTLQTNVSALGGVDVSALQTDLDTAEASIVTINGEMTAVEGRATTLEGEMNAVEGRATTLEGEMNAVEGRATTLEGEMNAVEGQATTLNGEMNAVEGRATTLEGEMNAVEGRATTLEGEMNAVEGRATTLEGEMTAVQSSVALASSNSSSALVGTNFAVSQVTALGGNQMWTPIAAQTGNVTALDTEIVCLLTNSSAIGYKISLEDVQLSLDNTQIYMEFSTDFGVSYITASGSYHWANALSNRTNPSTGSSSAQGGDVSMKIQGNSNKGLDDDHPTRRLTFEVFLGDGANFRNALKWDGGVQLFDSTNTNTLTTVLNGYGEMFTPTTRVNGVRFTLSQGSWTRATYKTFSRIV